MNEIRFNRLSSLEEARFYKNRIGKKHITGFNNMIYCINFDENQYNRLLLTYNNILKNNDKENEFEIIHVLYHFLGGYVVIHDKVSVNNNKYEFTPAQGSYKEWLDEYNIKISQNSYKEIEDQTLIHILPDGSILEFNDVRSVFTVKILEVIFKMRSIVLLEKKLQQSLPILSEEPKFKL